MQYARGPRRTRDPGYAGAAVTRIVVVPAAPVLLPEVSRQQHPDCDEVLAACDSVLSQVASDADEVTIIAAPDQLRDLTGPAVRRDRAVGDRVAEALLDRVGFRGARVRCAPGDSPRIGSALMFLADGSADVTAKSPRPGAGGRGFDADLEAALRRGDFAALAAITDSTAMAVGCVTAPVWRSLAAWVPGGGRCHHLAQFAPFGVSYFVGSWTTEAGTR